MARCGLSMDSIALAYDRALWALRFSRAGIGAIATRHGALGLRSPAHALRREGLVGDLLHDGDGALDHERYGLSVETHAVARGAAGGVGSDPSGCVKGV